MGECQILYLCQICLAMVLSFACTLITEESGQIIAVAAALVTEGALL